KYDEENGWLYLNWIGFVSSENLKKGAELMLEIVSENQYAYILNDNRELCGPWDKSIEWLNNNWTKQISEAGLKYFAHILAPNIAGALSAQALQKGVVGLFEMQIFGNEERAISCLKTMQTASLDV